MNYETISIVGLGYIGLPTAAILASRGKKVIGVDINKEIVDTINCGRIHIVEPDLERVVRDAVLGGYLRATTSPESADVFLIAVPTPFKAGPSGPHHPDLSFIEAASKSIAPVLKRGNLVILESTSPVGATEQMAAWLAEARPDLSFPQGLGEGSDIRVAHCPERVLPGHVMQELVQNDRVIGGMTLKCSEAAEHLYNIFVQGKCVITTARTAEMCKLTENSFRDVNIAFANELSIICNKFNINVWELIKLANRHPRVNILQPGPGVGGHCIAVDPWFIVSAAPEEAELIKCARQVNDKKPEWVINAVNKMVESYLKDHPSKLLDQVKVACFGLAFKPNIDDLRESPAVAIASELARKLPGPIWAVEPHITSLPASLKNRVELVNNEEIAMQADILVFLVRHDSFHLRMSDYRNHQNVIDACGFFAG